MPFTPQTLDFLAENKLRNDKQWYQEHKPQFKKSRSRSLSHSSPPPCMR